MEKIENNDWHGWSIGQRSMYIGHLPCRKNVALYVEDFKGMKILAYFKDEESARLALSIIDEIVDSVAVKFV